MRGVFQSLRGVETTPLPASTPDITKAQIGGWLQFAAAVGISVGFLKPDEAEVLIGASGLVAFGIHTADAVIRNGRAKAIATLAATGESLGRGFMGKNAPAGDDIPPSPTLDGTGSEPPPDMKAALANDGFTVNSSPAVAEPPAGPPPPTPDELAAAKQAADDAAAKLAALQSRARQQ